MKPAAPQGSGPAARAATAESGKIGRNIAAVNEFCTREEHKRSASQRHAEGIGGVVGRPAFPLIVLLTRQNRVARRGERRAHLDLKVTLLIGQKTAKLIEVQEELRRDLPKVKDRQDSGAVGMQQALSPEGALAALGERLTSPDGSIALEQAAMAAEPRCDNRRGDRRRAPTARPSTQCAAKLASSRMSPAILFSATASVFRPPRPSRRTGCCLQPRRAGPGAGPATRRRECRICPACWSRARSADGGGERSQGLFANAQTPGQVALRLADSATPRPP